MSDQKKTGPSRLAHGDIDAVRNALPTDAEGDALLDSLFSGVGDEDEPTVGLPSERPPRAAAPVIPRDHDDEDEATRVLGSDQLLGALEDAALAKASALAADGAAVEPRDDDDDGEEATRIVDVDALADDVSAAVAEDADDNDAATRIVDSSALGDALEEARALAAAEAGRSAGTPAPQPVADEATTADEPAFEEPAFEEPAFEEPVFEEPAVAAAPAATAPETDEPVFEEPVLAAPAPPEEPARPAEELAAEPEPEPEAEVEQPTIAPPPPPRRTVPPRVAPLASDFPNERDASAHLVAAHARDGWAARAAWLREEAGAREGAAKASALLVVSELFAMAGDDQPARECAKEALAQAPSSPIAHRQVRGLAAQAGEWPAVLEALDTEARVMPTAASRAHSSWFGSEVARIKLGDTAGAKHRAEQAMRAHAADPRPHVDQFCEALAEADAGERATRPRLPAEAELAPLAASLAQSLAHRGLPSGVAHTPTHYERVVRARAALGAARLDEALSQLEGLVEEPSVGGGAAWLVASLASPRAETRSRAVAALGRVTGGTHGPAALRTLAARAIEGGDVEAARRALASGDSEAFSAADRVTLGALAGASLDETAAWMDTLVDDEELAPISLAGRSALRAEAEVATLAHGANAPAGEGRGRVAAELGRSLAKLALASPDDASRARGEVELGLGRLARLAPGSPLGRALSLELDRESGAVERVAEGLSSVHEGSADPHGERDAALAAALVAELARNDHRAAAEVDRAFAKDPTHGAALRFAVARAKPDVAARLLAEHADALPASPASSLLLTEAAARLATTNGPDAEGLLRRALEADPKSPFAAALGEQLAGARHDRESLLEWLRVRREAATDPLEQAELLVREASVLAESDRASATALLEEAHRARPDDLGLRELYERTSPEPLADGAAYRATRAAADPEGPDAAWLATQGALASEQAGDLQTAASLAQIAQKAGEKDLAPLVAYRAALGGHGTAELVSMLLPRARNSADVDERVEIYEQLAELDELGRGDKASGLLFRRTILEDQPGHLPTLRRVAHALTTEAREDELEPVALELAKRLEGAEAVAHASLSARIRLRTDNWDATREPVMLAYRTTPRSLWALRQAAAHARAAGDHRLAVEADLELAMRTDRPSEIATLSLRAAENALAAGDRQTARSLFERATEACPGHYRAQLLLADMLEEDGEHAGAAGTYEAAANASVVATEQVRLMHHAAMLWADHVGDPPRARRALEIAAELDPSYADVFPRLQAIYVAEGARAELADLLKRRLDVVTDPEERVAMEVLRGKALAEVGDSGAAKEALSAALDANPDHVDALGSFATICREEGDWEGAESALIRLARLDSDPAKQAEIYLQLGGIYDEHLPNPGRAETAYLEILKRVPEDITARERLVSLYARTGDWARAVAEQTNLVNGAAEAEDKCRRTIELAGIHETSGDAKKAEATLVAARKAWPKDVALLESLARFYQRSGQLPAANVLLDRAVSDARRALGTGRFEAQLFETVALVAELRGKGDAALVAKAVVGALEGEPAELGGAGDAAADPKLDELLAPEVLTPAFRELLHRTGSFLDAAVPFELAAVRATPIPPNNPVGEAIRKLAAAYRLPSIAIHVTPALGQVCIAANTSPHTIVLGASLLASPRDDVRTFLVHRALKVLADNTAAFSRTAPIDLWPLVAAYLKAFSPSWTPPAVDAAKLTDFYGRVTRAIKDRSDPHLGLLAAEVIGAIGNRASTLNTVVNGWGERVALLAGGDLNAALTGIAWAGGNPNAPPPTGKDRLTWISRNAGARELVVFAVSDAFAEARSRAGLGSRG